MAVYETARPKLYSNAVRSFSLDQFAIRPLLEPMDRTFRCSEDFPSSPLKTGYQCFVKVHASKNLN